MEHLIVILIILLIPAFVGYLIAKGKGRGAAGFWWSFFLGIIGWIVAASLEPSEKIRRERMIRDAQFMKELNK